MSNKFWSSLTEEIIQLFEDREIIETTEKNHERKQTFKFYKACKTGNVELVNSYLENGYDPCEYSNSAIRIANEKGCIAVVDRLLQDKRINTSNIVNTALYRACNYGHIAIVDLLLQNKLVNISNEIFDFFKINYHKSIVDRLQQEIQHREKVNQ
jgi:ankyrin repeat protein